MGKGWETVRVSTKKVPALERYNTVNRAKPDSHAQ
jgi:hypothetical protein